ncbi:MAG: sigma-54-dependent transcriptional regulator, partial [Clostridia bacterium]|nr:sigma-54-dependent transcriptional regulator [Clostridia bacterium]
DEIPSLASLYLSSLNMELGKQITGFEPNAMDMLVRYEWPNNFTQFKQVLYELATLTTAHYIRASTVAETLEKERTLRRHVQTAQTGVPIAGRTLDEITYEIIIRTVEFCNGNQSVAAQQLGISRTTLWRYLKR